MTKLSVPAHHRDLPRTLSHRFHRRHKMKLAPEDGVKFECDGCRLPGRGLRYQCDAGSCNVDLHVGCALAPPIREIGGSRFELRDKPPAPADRRHCDACGGPARGFVYHCPELDHDVHPCCADLPDRFKVAGLSFKLRMKRSSRRCVLCADDGEGRCSRCVYWSYRCDVGDGGGPVFLHVACATDLVASGETAVTSVSVGEAYNRVMASESKRVVVADGGLKRSSKKQPSGDAHRTNRSTGKEIVPAATSNRSTGKGIVPATRTNRSTGKEIVPVTRTNRSTGKEIVPAAPTNRSKSKEMVPVSAKHLKALLLQGRDAARSKSRGGRSALQRSLGVLGFLVRVVIGVIFGDPTALAVAFAGLILPNR